MVRGEGEDGEKGGKVLGGFYELTAEMESD